MEDRGLRQLSARLGHAFRDARLLEQALTHRSHGGINNERLEFLGDAALHLVVGEALYQRFPAVREGDLSRMRAELVKGTTLAAIAREQGLGEVLRLGPGERKSGGRRRDSILADALEAVAGALYLEGGLELCRRCLLTWFAGRLDDIRPGEANKDAKTRLQEWLQARQQPLPKYQLKQAIGEEHRQLFEVECEVAVLEEPCSGRGSSRRAAEQAAAEAALLRLEERT